MVVVQKGNRLPLRLLAACLIAFSVLLLPGCGKPKGTVSGTVKLKDGTPVTAGTTVIFWGANKAQYPAPVGPNGAYSVPDMPTGEMKITVQPPPDAAHSLTKTAPEKPVPINPKYTDQSKTPLKHTVESGKQEKNIELDP